MAAGVKTGAAAYLFFLMLIAYLLAGTGLVSDDFAQIDCLKDKSLKAIISIADPSGRLVLPAVLALPVEHYLITMWYKFFAVDAQGLLDVLKIAYIFLSFYCIAKFFGIFMKKKNALLVSFVFLFFPCHDATTYWFLGQYLTLSIAFYLYAYYLAHIRRPFLAVLLAFMASFVSHGSPVIAVSLAVLCVMKKSVRNAAILILPSIIFIAYYIVLSRIVPAEAAKLPGHTDLPAFIRQLALQGATFLDAAAGPSLWVKVYYAIAQLSVASIVVGAVAAAVAYKAYGGDRRGEFDPKLATALAVMALLSLAMFAATGAYPQMAFNLGNRVTIFGSLLIAYLIVAVPLYRPARIALLAILLLAALGASDHWKSWSRQERAVFARIQNNKEIQGYDDAGPLYVSGNQYSRYGPLNHIEFLSEESTTGPFFLLASRRPTLVTPINRRFVFKDGDLLDTKYGTSRPVAGHIYVYDSEQDIMRKIDAKEINAYIATLPPDRRHWIELVDMPVVRAIVLRLMPRLRYAL